MKARTEPQNAIVSAANPVEVHDAPPTARTWTAPSSRSPSPFRSVPPPTTPLSPSAASTTMAATCVAERATARAARPRFCTAPDPVQSWTTSSPTSVSPGPFNEPPGHPGVDSAVSGRRKATRPPCTAACPAWQSVVTLPLVALRTSRTASSLPTSAANVRKKTRPFDTARLCPLIFSDGSTARGGERPAVRSPPGTVKTRRMPSASSPSPFSSQEPSPCSLSTNAATSPSRARAGRVNGPLWTWTIALACGVPASPQPGRGAPSAAKPLGAPNGWNRPVARSCSVKTTSSTSSSPVRSTSSRVSAAVKARS